MKVETTRLVDLQRAAVVGVLLRALCRPEIGRKGGVALLDGGRNLRLLSVDLDRVTPATELIDQCDAVRGRPNRVVEPKRRGRDHGAFDRRNKHGSAPATNRHTASWYEATARVLATGAGSTAIDVRTEASSGRPWRSAG